MGRHLDSWNSAADALRDLPIFVTPEVPGTKEETLAPLSSDDRELLAEDGKLCRGRASHGSCCLKHCSF
jgi:hypothetical protein